MQAEFAAQRDRKGRQLLGMMRAPAERRHRRCEQQDLANEEDCAEGM